MASDPTGEKPDLTLFFSFFSFLFLLPLRWEIRNLSGISFWGLFFLFFFFFFFFFFFALFFLISNFFWIYFLGLFFFFFFFFFDLGKRVLALGNVINIKGT